MKPPNKIGFGGGCHWCTEAVFQSLIGMGKVEQGYIKDLESSDFSEAVIVHYQEDKIPLSVLIEIHLHTHKSTKNHSMREKYRSAVYYFEESYKAKNQRILKDLQQNFEEKIITQVLPFYEFLPSREQITNYYKKNPKKPFCKRYIQPKLDLLLKNYRQNFNPEFLAQD